MPSSFTRYVRHRCAVFLVLLLVIVPAAISQQENQYRNTLNEVSKEISTLSKKLNKDSGLLKSEQTRLKDTEQKIHKAQRQVSKIDQQISALQSTTQTTQKQLVEQQQNLEQLRDLLRELIVQRYKMPKQAFIKQIIKQQNPSLIGRLSQYWEYYQNAVQRKFTQTAQAQSKVTALLSVQQEELQTLASKKDQRQAQQSQLLELKKQRLKTLSRLDKSIQQDQKRITQLEKDRTRLQQLLAEIKRQAKKLAESKAKRDPVKGSFAKQRGRLKKPVNGAIEYGFGQRIAQSGMRAQGVFFRTDLGTQVRAIYDGRVLFSDYLKGYGLLMIIDHGDNHISLYGHNRVLLHKVGDEVKINQLIAEVGVSGGLKSPGLYFEIRENTTPINPGLWVQL